jgi:hypothetical protein
MRLTDRRTAMRAGLGLFLVAAALLFTAQSCISADTLPREISNDAFRRMTSDFSESGGSFRFEYMSNEREFQSVIPELTRVAKRGGVYVGVGPEQNFTYIAAVQPKMAFIVDIRRENMLEHLMYKAIFELSSNRVDFLSRLFSRKPPAGLTEQSSAKALFQAYSAVPPDPKLLNADLQAIENRLTTVHGFQLTIEDQSSIRRIHEAFYGELPGPGSFGGFGGGFRNAAYADLMTATDPRGELRSYLATEENFQIVRDLERKNLIVPLVGDFAGMKALRAVGKYIRDHDANVAAFYTSNVEQYLFQQGDDWSRFFANVAAFPVDSSSTFIRSSHFVYDSRGQVARQLGGGNFVSLLCPMGALIQGFKEGRVRNYDQVIRMSRP